MRAIRKDRNIVFKLMWLLFASIITLPAMAANIAYIYGDIAANGTLPSGNQAPYHQMLLTDTGPNGTSQFRAIVESEALTLHALMMCSTPSYMLMEPQTISVINEIRQYRKESKHPIYFTLDAGPNIHLLYPDNIAEQVSPFIKEVLQPYCVGGKMIYDKVGKGPQKLTHE